MTYKVSPADRIKDILGDEFMLTPNTVVYYTWVQGYETLHYSTTGEIGPMNMSKYSGAYHPDGTCEGNGICIHCGRTL